MLTQEENIIKEKLNNDQPLTEEDRRLLLGEDSFNNTDDNTAPNVSVSSPNVSSTSGINKGVKSVGRGIASGITNIELQNTMANQGLYDNPYGQAVGTTVAGTVSDLINGAPTSKMATNAVTRGVRSAATSALRSMNALNPFTSAGIGVLSALGNEATKTNPNYTRATFSSAIPTAVATVAGSILGPVGAVVAGVTAGYFTQDSLINGALGDWADSRQNEKARDQLEDLGWSREYTDTYSDHFGGFTGNANPSLNDQFSPDQATDPRSAYGVALDNFGKPVDTAYTQLDRSFPSYDVTSNNKGDNTGSGGFDDGATEDRGGDMGDSGFDDDASEDR